MASVFSQDLVCEWTRIEPLSDYAIAIYLPMTHCVDMNGAVKLSESIMPQVEMIVTVSGFMLDTVYMLDKGEWYSLLGGGSVIECKVQNKLDYDRERSKSLQNNE